MKKSLAFLFNTLAISAVVFSVVQMLLCFVCTTYGLLWHNDLYVFGGSIILVLCLAPILLAVIFWAISDQIEEY